LRIRLISTLRLLSSGPEDHRHALFLLAHSCSRKDLLPIGLLVA